MKTLAELVALFSQIAARDDLARDEKLLRAALVLHQDDPRALLMQLIDCSRPLETILTQVIADELNEVVRRSFDDAPTDADLLH